MMRSLMIEVLVIDDYVLDLRAAERAAKKLQFPLRMRTATDPASALALATSEPPDVILLDVNLGAYTGEEVVVALREAGVDAAIVLLTGSADAERVAAALSAGAIKYVPKSALDPARLESTLLGAMRVTVAERRAADAQRAIERRTRQLEQLVDTSVAIAAESSLEAMAEAAGRGAASMCTTSARARIEMHGAASEWSSSDEPDDVWAFEHARGGVRVVLGFARELLPDERLLVVELARILLGSAENVALVQEAREAAQDRQDIVAIVSHDLRTPLQSLSLGIDAIRLGLESGRTAEELGKTTDRMRRSVASMSRLLDDLLDVSRIHDQKLRISPQRTELDALLADVREQHQPIAAAKGLRLRVEGTSGLAVEADPARLSQALANLVSNAVRHTEGGEVVLSASPRAGGVRLAVRDTGSGVPREVQSKLFERLYQSDGARRGALGLGLYIVRGIAEAHGGAVGVESEPGRGALFFLDLPARPAGAPP
jgi:signal transduction histidine kinase